MVYFHGINHHFIPLLNSTIAFPGMNELISAERSLVIEHDKHMMFLNLNTKPHGKTQETQQKPARTQEGQQQGKPTETQEEIAKLNQMYLNQQNQERQNVEEQYFIKPPLPPPFPLATSSAKPAATRKLQRVW